MKPAIGLAALTVMELTPPEQVAVAAQAGYSHVGLRLIPVAGQTLAPFDPRELEQRLADTGIKVLDLEVFRLATRRALPTVSAGCATSPPTTGSTPTSSRCPGWTFPPWQGRSGCLPP